MMRLWILLLCCAPAILAFPAYAASPVVCADLLASGGYKVILRQANELNPAVLTSADPPVPLQELYLQLKEQESAPPAVQDLRAHLVEARGRQFRVAELNDQDLLQFYRNSVRALYIRVAALWRVQEVRNSVGPVMTAELEEAGGHLLDQYFSPWGLDSEDLSLEEASRHFRERKWMSLPWLSIAQFLSEWKEHHPGRYPGTEFSRFWSQRADAYHLPFELYQPLLLALGKGKRPSACCLSVPGCTNCPHNRRALK